MSCQTEVLCVLLRAGDRLLRRCIASDECCGIIAGRTFDELSLPSLSLAKASSTSAQPPLALSEERVRAQGGRQLGYDCPPS